MQVPSTVAGFCQHDSRIQSFEFEYASAWESFGSFSIPKIVQRLITYSVDEEQQDFDLDITVDSEFTTSRPLGAGTAEFNTDTDGYGMDEYGADPWGASIVTDDDIECSGDQAKSVRARFTNSNIEQQVCISGWEWEYEAPIQAAKEAL
jgi:hypothetical protein